MGKKEIRDQLARANQSAQLTFLIATLEAMGDDVSVGQLLDAADDETAARIKNLRCVSVAALLSGESADNLRIYVEPTKGKRRRKPPTNGSRAKGAVAAPKKRAKKKAKAKSQGTIPGIEPTYTDEQIAELKERTGCESIDEVVFKVVAESEEPLGSRGIRDTMKEKWGLVISDGEFRHAIGRLKKALKIEQKGRQRGAKYLVLTTEEPEDDPGEEDPAPPQE